MERDLPFRAKRTVAVVSITWLLIVLIAPWTLAPGTVTDLSGRPSSIDNQAQVDDMNPFAAAIYFLGDFNCHQKVERSLFLNENQMPFCARDVGIFVGVAMGMVIMLFLSPRFSLLVLAALVVPILVDGGLQYMGGYESTNAMRLATGMLGGAAVAYLLNHVAESVLSPEQSRR